MKTILTILLLSMTCFANPKLIVKQSLVHIVSEQLEGSGSGVIIQSSKNKTIILTNKHVCMVAQNSRFRVKAVKDYNKNSLKYYPAKIDFMSINKDLCILKSKKQLKHAAKIAEKDVNLGDTLLTYVNYGRILGVFSQGIAGHIVLFPENKEYMMSNLYGFSGSSGSGVFNKNGELVGIVTVKIGRDMGHIRLEHIKNFLDNYINANKE